MNAAGKVVSNIAFFTITIYFAPSFFKMKNEENK